MPTPLKDPSVRARKNRSGTEADLAPEQAVRGSDLPADRDWHERTKEWWEALRSSPQALLYTPLDWIQARDVAVLRDEWERKPSAHLFSLVQRASIGLGLDKADQRRNGWARHVAAPPPAPAAAPPLPQPTSRPVPRRVRDPRKVLRSVPGARRRSA